jgi:very-short-patch-repair endonuclease
MRKALSKPEAMLWLRLRALRAAGYHVRRQVPIGPYFADFACHAARLVIEVDGAQHGDPGAQAHDVARDRWFARQGYGTLRIEAREVLTDPDLAVDRIVRELSMRRGR